VGITARVLGQMGLLNLETSRIILGAAVIDDVANEIQGAAQRQQPALAVRRDAAGDDQPYPAGRALAVEGGEFAVVIETVFEPGVHRAHDHAVLQRRETEVERGEEMGVGAVCHPGIIMELRRESVERWL